MQLSQLQSDPFAFQNQITVPTGSGPARFSDVMADFQRKRFRAFNASLIALTRHDPPPIQRVWDERTKGASKDSDWSVNLLWLLAFSRRPLRIQIGAYDQQQADEIRLIVKGILKLDGSVNRFLSQVIEVQQTRIINRNTDSTCEILTTDKLGSHGARPDMVLINELTHQSDPGFAETLLDNLDKMPNGFGVIATNAGHDPSWQLNWKRTFAASPRWKVGAFRRPAPWIDSQALEESEKRNSQGRYQRLWWGIWGSDSGSAIDAADIDACVTQTSPMDGSERGYTFVAGLDIGIRKHSTGLAIIGKHVGFSEEKPKKRKPRSTVQQAMIDLEMWEEPEEDVDYIYHEATGRIRLAHVQSWTPKPGKRVSLESVKAAIILAHQRFNLAGIALDPHQGEHLIELLERENIPVIRSVQNQNTLQDQATTLIEHFQERTIDLYRHDDLIADLKRLQIKDTGLKTRLVSPETKEGQGTAHGDLASALSFALALVARKSLLPNFHDTRTLCVWP